MVAVGLEADECRGGGAALIQRFSSAAHLNIHLHLRVLNGVYRCGAARVPIVVEVSAPPGNELHALSQTVITRLMNLLVRKGELIEGVRRSVLSEPDAEEDEARATVAAAADGGHHSPHRVRAPRRAENANPLGSDCRAKPPRGSRCSPKPTASA